VAFGRRRAATLARRPPPQPPTASGCSVHSSMPAAHRSSTLQPPPVAGQMPHSWLEETGTSCHIARAMSIRRKSEARVLLLLLLLLLACLPRPRPRPRRTFTGLPTFTSRVVPRVLVHPLPYPHHPSTRAQAGASRLKRAPCLGELDFFPWPQVLPRPCRRRWNWDEWNKRTSLALETRPCGQYEVLLCLD
jgi:hypothetical protein